MPDEQVTSTASSLPATLVHKALPRLCCFPLTYVRLSPFWWVCYINNSAWCRCWLRLVKDRWVNHNIRPWDMHIARMQHSCRAAAAAASAERYTTERKSEVSSINCLSGNSWSHTLITVSYFRLVSFFTIHSIICTAVGLLFYYKYLAVAREFSSSAVLTYTMRLSIVS